MRALALLAVALGIAACQRASDAPGAQCAAAHGHGHGHADAHGHQGGHEHQPVEDGPRGPLVHRFEHAEEWAKAFDDPARDTWQKPAAVVGAMDLRAGMVVADVGAGTGYFEPWLARAVGPGGTVLALDVEPDMVRYLRERAAREGLTNVRASVVSPDDPALASVSAGGKVDRVLIVDTWHHIAAREAYAKRLAAGLAPDGAVFVVDFTMDAAHGPPKDHRVAPERVARELASAGLRAEIVPVDLPDQYVVVGRR